MFHFCASHLQAVMTAMNRRRLFQLPTIAMFLVATVTGMIMFFVVRNSSLRNLSDRVRQWTGVSQDELYRIWLRDKGLQQIDGEETQHKGASHKVVTEAKYLLEETRILCVVMLDSNTLKWRENVYITDEYVPTTTTAELAIMLTWGRHCSKVLFFSMSISVDVPVINLDDVSDIYSWSAYHKALVHVSKQHINDFKWFLIIEEDSYVLMENLAYYLSVFNQSMPMFLGHVYSAWGMDYNSGGPGIVMNQAALNKLHQRLVKGHCTESRAAGDVTLAQCLIGAGIYPGDSRDHLGRSRFMMFQPELHLIPGILSLMDNLQYWSRSKYPIVEKRTLLDNLDISTTLLPSFETS